MLGDKVLNFVINSYKLLNHCVNNPPIQRRYTIGQYNPSPIPMSQLQSISQLKLKLIIPVHDVGNSQPVQVKSLHEKTILILPSLYNLLSLFFIKYVLDQLAQIRGVKKEFFIIFQLSLIKSFCKIS
jgi:hypothetical protein